MTFYKWVNPILILLAGVCALVVFHMIGALPVGGKNTTTPNNEFSWYSPTRSVKVAKLNPGRKIQKLSPDTLFAPWSAM